MPSSPSNRLAIRPWREDDIPTLHRINQASRPEVGDIDRAGLARLLALSAPTLVAEVLDAAAEPVIAGFVLCLLDGVDYASGNYRWFAARYDRFAYVDRIAIDQAYRGRGLGGQLYNALERDLGGRRALLTCEVNEQPPNPASIAFHTALGFDIVGRQAHRADYAVVMMAKRLLP